MLLVALLILFFRATKVQPMDAFLTYLKTTTQKELADKLGCHPSAISQWITNNQIPAERLFQLERITGISPRALRPDLFIEPKPTAELRAQ